MFSKVSAVVTGRGRALKEGLNWSEDVQKGRCGVKAGTGCTQHSKAPVSGGDSSQLMPRAFQSSAELWQG